MKILITGGDGQLGTELRTSITSGQTEIGAIKHEFENAVVKSVDIDTLDITNLHDVKYSVKQFSPDIIINCAAFTNVDKCETEADTAFAVNAIGPRNLAIAAKEAGAKLIHISTDYVFNGNGTKPYAEFDNCDPQSVYGYTKYAGEQLVKTFCDKHFIVRTSWLYGRFGNNFVKTILKLAEEKDQIKVVSDQIGSPTNVIDLVHCVLIMAASEEYGTYHCTGSGQCSWFDFACEIVRLSGLSCNVTPCTTEEFPRPAKRPGYSVLDNQMLRCAFGYKTRHWQEAIASFL